FVFSMEMWARKHPPESLAALAAQAARDSAEWVDRFAIPDSGALVPAVGTYLGFVAESPHGGLIHNYVNHGMRHLMRAIMGVSNLNLRVGTVEKMQIMLGRYVDSLQVHPRWTLDPGRVRPAMLMAVEIMGSLNIPYDQATRDRIRKAEEAAQALVPGQSTLWQRARVQEFFIQSGIALVMMKDRAVAGTAGKPAPAP
ncbi:MAG TPA: hypothetical protein VJ385_20205, partial [Fibrobacteria bacterium]|nr:hypothetical protein [Fibrobacteria bacterium]